MHDADFLHSCTEEEAQALQAAVPTHDPMLMRILLGGVVGALPKSRVDDISDVLFDMLQVWLLLHSRQTLHSHALFCATLSSMLRHMSWDPLVPSTCLHSLRFCGDCNVSEMKRRQPRTLCKVRSDMQYGHVEGTVCLNCSGCTGLSGL